MEHTWNTSTHSVLKAPPFETAHDLPVRSALDSWAEEPAGQNTDLMTTDGLDAMRATAEAFETEIQNLKKAAAEQNAEMNRKGKVKKYEEAKASKLL